MGSLSAGGAFISQLGLSPWFVYSVASLAFYPTICSSLRFQRLKSMRRRFNYLDRDSLSRMTNEDAQKIVHAVSVYEFPLLYDLALKYAIFKSYTIDQIGNLLYRVSDLSRPTEASKRYDDTSVLLTSLHRWRLQLCHFCPGSDTLALSIARTNFMHNPYLQSGKIKNEDMLYVLFDSMYEPVRFMKLYEWRELSDMEVAAFATVWRYLGDMMEIDFKAELGKDEWKDGIKFFDDMVIWAKDFQMKHLEPSPSIIKLGETLRDLLLSTYPKFMQGPMKKILMVLVGERLRHVFGFDEPGMLETSVTYIFLLVRQFVLRYLTLPRIFPEQYISQPDDVTGRIQHYKWLKDPWYTPATFWSRWGPEAWFRRAFDLKIAGDGGEVMRPGGFLFEDIGPRNKIGKGMEETVQLARIAHTRVAAGGCPFALPRKF
ncbi:hypothetical protein ACQKWADRAFT_327748 [Trichoderma austrokoningii]